MVGSRAALVLSLTTIASLFVGCAIAQNAPAGGSGVSTTPGSAGSTCNWQQNCPNSAPCCSEYGYCSSGVGCLNGCNPQWSAAGYCAPMPVCQSTNYTFADTSRIAMNASAYNGDASKYDFTLDKQDGTNSIIDNGELAMTLTESGGGTRLSTTRAVLYANIEASIKTVGAPGVVTAFITMSGSKDEIDWEWTGNNTDEGQTNYFWEGYLNDYQNGGTATAKNRASSYVVYGFNWTPDSLQWTVGGKVVRTLQRSSTYDSASGNYQFPQTPSRIQMSVWPAGTSASAQGTIDWSGGLIDWSQAPFQAHIQWISVQCYDNSNLSYVAGNTTSSTNSSSRLVKREDSLWERANLVERGPSINSYLWGVNNSAGQIQVAGSDAATIINSAYSTGKNMIVKGSDTKGVTATNASGNALANSAVGNWWSKLATAAKVGIIAGIVLFSLFLIVALCTCCARRKDQAKAKAYKPVGDAIPLKNTSKSSTSAQRPPGPRPQASQASLASSMNKYNESPYDQSAYHQPTYDHLAPQWPSSASTDYHQQQYAQQGYYQQPSTQQYAHGNYYAGSHTSQAPQWPQGQQEYPQRGARY